MGSEREKGVFVFIEIVWRRERERRGARRGRIGEAAGDSLQQWVGY